MLSLDRIVETQENAGTLALKLVLDLVHLISSDATGITIIVVSGTKVAVVILVPATILIDIVLTHLVIPGDCESPIEICPL